MNNYFLSFVVLVLSIVSFNCVAMKTSIEEMHKEYLLDRVLYSTEKEAEFLVPKDLKRAEDKLWYFIDKIVVIRNKSKDGELHVYASGPLSQVVQSFTESMKDLLKRADKADKADIYNRFYASLQSFEWATKRSIVLPNSDLYFNKSYRDETLKEKLVSFTTAYLIQERQQNEEKLVKLSDTWHAVVQSEGMASFAEMTKLDVAVTEFGKKLEDVHKEVRPHWKHVIVSKKILFKQIPIPLLNIK